MEANNWCERLAQAVEASGMSRRSVSLSAGNGPGYVHSILAEGKDPSVANLLAICNVLNVSLSKVLYGFEISPETEEILKRLEDHPEPPPLTAPLRRGFSSPILGRIRTVVNFYPLSGIFRLTYPLLRIYSPHTAQSGWETDRCSELRTPAGLSRPRARS